MNFESEDLKLFRKIAKIGLIKKIRNALNLIAKNVVHQ